MKTKFLTLFAFVFVFVSASVLSPAQTIVVAVTEGSAGQTVDVPVRAHAAPGITAAACRVLFDTAALNVTVTSTLFSSFATQFAGGGVVQPSAVSATVAGETFTSPLVVRPGSHGLTIAGARHRPSTAGDPVVFTLHMALKPGAAPGLYPVTLASAVATASGAGYPAGGEPIPLLLGWNPAANSYPVIAAITPGTNPVTPGSVQFYPEDTDGDGLGDAWEIQHYGSLTAAGAATDSDGDGFGALLEQLFATNPSHPDGDAVAAFGPPNGEFAIRFPLRANTRVIVEWSSDATAWSTGGVSITPRPDLGSGPDWTMQKASVSSSGHRRLLLRVRGNPSPLTEGQHPVN